MQCKHQVHGARFDLFWLLVLSAGCIPAAGTGNSRSAWGWLQAPSLVCRFWQVVSILSCGLVLQRCAIVVNENGPQFADPDQRARFSAHAAPKRHALVKPRFVNQALPSRVWVGAGRQPHHTTRSCHFHSNPTQFATEQDPQPLTTHGRTSVFALSLTPAATRIVATWNRARDVVFGFGFLVCYAATPLALQVQQKCIQVVRSNRVAWKRPARGHSRNGPWTWSHTHTHIGKHKTNRTKHTSINTQHVWIGHIRNRNWFFTISYLFDLFCIHCIVYFYVFRLSLFDLFIHDYSLI